MIWRELVGWGSMLGFLKQSERVFSLLRVFLLLRRPGEPQSVLGSIGVMLMSCKVNLHLVRSALQNSICLLKLSKLGM